MLLVATINVFCSLGPSNTAYADNYSQNNNSWYDSNQKPPSVFDGFYDPDQVPNNINNEWNDGTLSVTSRVVGSVNAKTGVVSFIDQIVLTNLTSNKEISFNSVSAKLNPGFESADIKNWEIKNSESILFSGTAGTQYTPDLVLDSNESKTFNVSTGLTGLKAGSLANKTPFNFVYDYEAKDKINYFYKVCVWGINEDTYDANPTHLNGLTFGPAIGETNACLEHDGHHEHCIHNDSWETIIANCNAGHADWYSDCLNDGCTKAVPINMNTTLGKKSTTKVECSTLQNANYINSTYRKWNNTYDSNDCESANYATSRLRATMIGSDNMVSLSTYAGTDCLDSSNCLLSCFPKVLQNNIKPKYMEVATTWEISSSTTPPYKINMSTFVADKLWIMNANENYTTPYSYLSDYRSQYTKAHKMRITTSVYSNNKVYNELGSRIGHWLRCPDRSRRYYGGAVSTDGRLGNSNVDYTFALSPCFCL